MLDFPLGQNSSPQTCATTALAQRHLPGSGGRRVRGERVRSMQQDTSPVRRQVVALLPDAPLDERTVQVRSAEGVHQFGVDLITTASEAGFGAVSAPIVADLLAGKPAVVVVQGDDADCGLTLGFAKSLLGLLFDRVAAAPAGVDCELTASCVELTLALIFTPAPAPAPTLTLTLTRRAASRRPAGCSTSSATATPWARTTSPSMPRPATRPRRSRSSATRLLAAQSLLA